MKYFKRGTTEYWIGVEPLRWGLPISIFYLNQRVDDSTSIMLKILCFHFQISWGGDGEEHTYYG